MNKRQKHYWDCYCDSSDSYLYKVYGSYSTDKAKAFDDCLADMKEHDGTDLRIMTHSRWQFTVGYRYTENGKKYFRIITKYGKESCEIC